MQKDAASAESNKNTALKSNFTQSYILSGPNSMFINLQWVQQLLLSAKALSICVVLHFETKYTAGQIKYEPQYYISRDTSQKYICWNIFKSSAHVHENAE